ncbi:glycosyl hydrolase [Priestia megaterium]|uniref:GH39 family glycosyl hydrolase n=1 Tax=Priestia megaterium TaxID=1404 RepID=UPI003458D0ED
MGVKIMYFIKILLIGSLLLFVGCENEKKNEDRIKKTYFGMHLQNPNIFSSTLNSPHNLGYGTIRLWDTGTKWRNLEINKGEFDFTRLDQMVSEATQYNQEILLTLGQPPNWATGGKSLSWYGENYNSIPPNSIEDWKNYLKTVGERYKGKIQYYEIWNEANVKGFYSGSVEDLVNLTNEANKVLKEIDPNIKIVSPSMADGQAGVEFLNKFLKAGGGEFIDVISLHLYVNPSPPEEVISLIRKYKEVINRNNFKDLPIWNTEFTWVNFMLDGEIEKSKIMPDELAAAYLSRMLLINASMDIERSYFYGMDYESSKIRLIERSNPRWILLPGIAYKNIASWLTGAVIEDFSQEKGYYLLTFESKEGEKGIIAWTEYSKKKIKLPSGFLEGKYYSTIGEINNYSDGEIYLTGMPVLIYEN